MLLCILGWLLQANAVRGWQFILSRSGVPKTEAINWRLATKSTAHISSGKNYYRLLLLYFICYHVFVPQVICTYMAKQTLFQIELNSLEVFFSVWDIIFPYWETLSENGSHRLTGAHNSSTLEAMNWRLYCIPRVGVHYLGAPCVRPAPIGTCPSGALN